MADVVRSRKVKCDGWIKKYGTHVVVCAVIAAVAFGINWKINIDRRYEYTVSEPAPALLKEVTGAKTEGNALLLYGWGFDTTYYGEDSACELILQDTQTGEALWPKMEKNPEPVQIAERYTNGEDYSGTGFVGRLKADALDAESVYEIFVRYMESGKGSQPIVVTTDTFLYHGEITEYNPSTYVQIETENRLLNEKLGQSRLFYYFPEGMWVYYNEGELIYVLGNDIEITQDMWLPVHRYVADVRELPEESREGGMQAYNNYWNDGYRQELSDDKYQVATFGFPSQETVQLRTGLYERGNGWVFTKLKEIR